MPLPMPPQMPVSQMGGFGGVVQAQPPKPSGGQQAAGILQGIAQFMRDFKAGREVEKSQAKAEFDQQMSMLSQGVPLNLKEVAKKAKKAGIPLDLEGPSAQQLNQQHEKTSQANFMEMSEIGGGPAPMAPPSLPQQSAQPQAQPSGWQKVMQGMGFSQPPISPVSPGMKFLEAMMQSGKTGMDTKSMMQTADHKTQMIRMAALQGNPQAVEMYTKLGGMQEPKTEWGQLKDAAKAGGIPDNKAAELFLDVHTGGPQMRQTQLKIAAEMAQKDVDVRLKANDLVLQYTKEFPGLPPAVAYQLALGSATGNTELFSGAMKALQGLKSETSLRREDVAFEQKMKQLSHYVDLEKLGIDKARLGLEGTRVSQGWAGLDKEQQRINLEKTKIDTEIMRSIRKEMGEDFDRYYRIAANKDVDSKAKDVALEQMVNAANRMGDIKVKLTTGESVTVSLGKLTKKEVGGILFSDDPWSTISSVKPTAEEMGKAPSQTPAWMQQLIGMPQPGVTPSSPEMQEEWKFKQGVPYTMPAMPPLPGSDISSWLQQLMQKR